MNGEDDFRIRSGRIHSTKAQQARPFIAQALAAARKTGGSVSRKGKIGPGNRSRFGSGQRAAVQANRLITTLARRRRQSARRPPRRVWRTARDPPRLPAARGRHPDGEKARPFGPSTDEADPKAFAERCADDHHHFRFIVSPDALDRDGARLVWAGRPRPKTFLAEVHQAIWRASGDPVG